MKRSSDETINFAKYLRKNMTDCEQKLWYYLRGKRFFGYKFKRQVPIDKYVVDFLCTDTNLIIELDGSQHLNDKKQYDIERDNYLSQKGYRIIRILDNDLKNIESVLEFIYKNIEKVTPSP
ncbi:endonuclease domain-containing protein [bacterium]|nr:endonuclease domain-containing protein [bacterium]